MLQAIVGLLLASAATAPFVHADALSPSQVPSLFTSNFVPGRSTGRRFVFGSDRGLSVAVNSGGEVSNSSDPVTSGGSGAVWVSPAASATSGLAAMPAPAQPPKLTPKLMDQLIAGSVARTVAQTVLNPVDVWRCRGQMGTAMTWDIQTLMFGMGPVLLLSAPSGALQFTALEFTKRGLSRNGTALPALGGDFGVNLIAGCVGALAMALTRVPQEVLKQGIQGGLFKNTFDAIAQTWGTSILPQPGALSKLMRGWQGFAVTNYVDVPWNAISYLCFEAFRSQYVKRAKRDPDTKMKLMLGCAGGIVACVLTHPIDIVKTRIMTSAADAGAQQSIMAGITAMVDAEGYGVLFAGLLPRLLHMSPFAAIALTAYTSVLESIMRLKQRRADKDFFANLTPGRPVATGNTTAPMSSAVGPVGDQGGKNQTKALLAG